MADSALFPDLKKVESTLLVLFIPSVDRDSVSIDQERWVKSALEKLGTWFGGATAFPRGRGVWRDDARGVCLVFDNPVVIFCYTNDPLVYRFRDDLIAFLREMGGATNQGAVGFVLANDYLELAISSEET